MKITFDTKGNSKQKEAAAAWANPAITDIVYGGAKGGGKSYLGASLIFGNALMYPDTRYFISRKKLNDIRKHTIPTIEKVFSDWGISIDKYAKFNAVDNMYKLYNGSTVLLIEAKYIPSDPLYERFGSMTMTQGWIEEAGEYETSSKSSLAISVGRWNNDKYGLPGKLLMTCNPKKNFLYKDFYIPWKAKKLPENKAFIQALVEDNKAVDAGYKDRLKAELTGRDRDRLLKGDWEYSDDADSLIEYDKILDIFSNTHVPKGDKKITADIARLGGDKIVCIAWEGWRGKVFAWDREKITKSATLIETIRFRHGCGKSDTLIDADGMGVGMQDFMDYKGFVNNSKPMPDPKRMIGANGKPEPENFDMLKSQCYYRLADRINNNGVYLECDDEEIKTMIVEELEQVKQKEMDSDLKKGVMPKSEVKEALGRSPDFADAIMMREWFELRPTFKPTAISI